MDFTVLAVVLLLGVGIPLRNRRFRKRRMQKGNLPKARPIREQFDCRRAV